MAKNASNIAPVEQKHDAFGADLVSIPTGFPPYWEPASGRVIDLIPQLIDTTDDSFVRIVCKNIGDDIQCATGPKNDDGEAEPVLVRHGELFTVGWYATLPLELALADQVPVRVTVMELDKKAGKNPDGSPKKLWRFKYQTTGEGQKLLAKEKARIAAFGPRNLRENPQYLMAFTPEGLKLSAPPHEGRTLPQAQAPDAES